MLMALLAYCGEMCTLSYFSRVRMGFGRRVLPLLFSHPFCVLLKDSLKFCVYSKGITLSSLYNYANQVN